MTILSKSSRLKSISKPKLLAIVIILIVASTSFYLGQVLATPAPSRSSIVTPGTESQSCTYFIYLDGTTPVARFGTTGDQSVGTAGQDMGVFMNALTAVNTKYCFEGGNYVFSTVWTVTSGMSIVGQYNATVFNANTNSMSILAFPNAGQATNPRTTNVDVEDLSFNSNGKTQIVGVNFNESINENSNHIRLDELHFLGQGWSYIIIGDGNEDSIVTNIYSDLFGPSSYTGCGDVSWKTYTGTAYLYTIIFGEISGCTSGSRVHVIGNLLLKDSVLGGINLECQIGSQTGSGGTNNCTGSQMTFDGDWFCNGNGGPVLYAKNGQSVTINTVIIKDAVICIPTNTGILEVNSTGTQMGFTTMQIIHSSIRTANDVTSAMFYSSAGGSGHINFNSGITVNDCYIAMGGSAWVYTNSNAGSVTIPQFHYVQNYIQAPAPAKGNVVHTAGAGDYYMLDEPAGFRQSTTFFGGNTPGLPAGTGSGNSQTNLFGWPVRIYYNATKAAGTLLVVGAHVIDTANTDSAILGNPQYIELFPAEKVYFATAVPYAWQWYGMAW